MKVRRTDGLVGNGLVLTAALLYLCEFVGIIGSNLHTMPGVPGDHSSLRAMYAGQTSATGFVVGWAGLVLPGRVLLVLGMRQALIASDSTGRLSAGWRTLLSWAVVLMGLGVAAELVESCVNAGTAAAAASDSSDVVFALDRVAHYLLASVYGPSGTATAIVGVAMWRSGVFPRVLAALMAGLGAIGALNGALLSGPATAPLQDGLTVINLLAFVVLLWLGILVFRHRPTGTSATS